MHAFGTAVDINPVENPYVDGSLVSPPNGEPYADRSDARPGMVYERDVVWSAFRTIGWQWGGTWLPTLDYQHFSSNDGGGVFCALLVPGIDSTHEAKGEGEARGRAARPHPEEGV
jgi:hypothetical protein